MPISLRFYSKRSQEVKSHELFSIVVAKLIDSALIVQWTAKKLNADDRTHLVLTRGKLLSIVSRT